MGRIHIKPVFGDEPESIAVDFVSAAHLDGQRIEAMYVSAVVVDGKGNRAVQSAYRNQGADTLAMTLGLLIQDIVDQTVCSGNFDGLEPLIERAVRKAMNDGSDETSPDSGK